MMMIFSEDGNSVQLRKVFDHKIVTNTYNRLKIELIEDGETSNIEFVSTADGNSLQVFMRIDYVLDIESFVLMNDKHFLKDIMV